MTEYSSRGDPRRSMALLWGRGEPPTRGPKQALSVPEIVGAAVAPYRLCSPAARIAVRSIRTKYRT